MGIFLCKLTNWPAPSRLDSSVGKALHWYCRGHGFKSRSFFQALISQLFKLCAITAMVNHICISFSTVQVYKLGTLSKDNRDDSRNATGSGKGPLRMTGGEQVDVLRSGPT